MSDAISVSIVYSGRQLDRMIGQELVPCAASIKRAADHRVPNTEQCRHRRQPIVTRADASMSDAKPGIATAQPIPEPQPAMRKVIVFATIISGVVAAYLMYRRGASLTTMLGYRGLMTKSNSLY